MERKCQKLIVFKAFIPIFVRYLPCCGVNLVTSLPQRAFFNFGEGIVNGTYIANSPQVHYVFHLENVDWVGVGLDAGGILADAVSFGAGGRVINGIQVGKGARVAGQMLDSMSLLQSGMPLAVDLAEGDAMQAQGVDFGLALTGVYIPILPDVISLGRGLKQGLEIIGP